LVSNNVVMMFTTLEDIGVLRNFSRGSQGNIHHEVPCNSKVIPWLSIEHTYGTCELQVRGLYDCNPKERKFETYLHNGVKCQEVCEAITDALDGLLALCLQVFTTRLGDEAIHQRRQHILLRHRLRMVGRVSPNLAERPSTRTLDMVLDFGYERIQKWWNPLRCYHCESQRLGEGRDVTQSHHSCKGQGIQ
jgi:hypothetical protein